ncbi:MAG: hypothetical protein ACKOE8_06655 [Opitutaceae bacterium]
MPFLAHPPLQPLIRSIPVAEHSVNVSAAFWEPLCRVAGRGEAFSALFAAHSHCRGVRTLAILPWGYPSGARARIHEAWLARLPEIAEKTGRTGLTWTRYHQDLVDCGGLGISTITKLAHFRGQTFAGRSALILDQRILGVLQADRWGELRELTGLRYHNAAANYLQYLEVLHGVAVVGGYAAAQLEFFLFALGDSF